MRCSLCKGEFEVMRSDEEALAEFKRDFPNYPTREATFVCDDCYKRIMEPHNVDLH